VGRGGGIPNTYMYTWYYWIKELPNIQAMSLYNCMYVHPLWTH